MQQQTAPQYVGQSMLGSAINRVGSDIPEREPEVQEQIGDLGIEVSELEALIVSLESKFESVLQPSPPVENGTGISACKRTRVGDQLHTLSLRLQTARSRIVSILERAEV